MENISSPIYHSVPQSFSSESPRSEPQTPSMAQLPITDLPVLPSVNLLHSPLGHSVSPLSPTGNVSYETSPEPRWDHCSSGPPLVPHSGSDLDPLFFSPRVRSCDVYIGVCGRRPSLLRFVRWLRAELEMHGISCFILDRSRCKDAFAHRVAGAAMDAAAFGVVVVTRKCFKNCYCIEEIRMFLERKKLVPIFFGLAQVQCMVRDIVERRGEVWSRYGGNVWLAYGGLETEWRDAVNGLSQIHRKLEVNASNYRDCVLQAVALLGMGLGRKSVVERVRGWKELAAEEFPFPRNVNFVGRNKELLELELLLFGDVEGEGASGCIEFRTHIRHRRNLVVMREKVVKESEERRRKGKEPVVWKEFEEEIEMQGESPLHITTEQNVTRPHRRNSPGGLLYGKGIACVTGDSGIGKTELLLEFSHRFSQRYKMVLWVSGESKYIRLNFMKLLPLLGIDWSMENKLCPERNEPRNFKEMEKEAIGKVKKELMRDIPYLLVIDNLESEKDWWDGRDILELLPRFGGATHVMISTRLPRIVNIEPLRLLYLSGAEAMLLMKGGSRDLKIEEANALRVIEERLGRLPLGLAIVRAIISEVPISPSKLLDAVNRMPYRDFTWSRNEDSALKHNPFLVQLLDFCFSLLDRDPGKLATKMIQASKWFAPSSVPISMLALAANRTSEGSQDAYLWRKWRRIASCMCMRPSVPSLDVKASWTMLVKFGIAQISKKVDCMSFHDIVKLYAFKRGDDGIADSVVRAICIEGSLPQHMEHIWAACLLMFKFGNGPVTVNLSISDLLSFIERFVLPLAMHNFNAYSLCSAVLELLRVAIERLEELEESFLSNPSSTQTRSSKCLASQSTLFSDPHLYQKFAYLRATLLETKAKLMVKGGLYDEGERDCKKAVNIKEVIYGDEHLETLTSRRTLEHVRRLKSVF